MNAQLDNGTAAWGQTPVNCLTIDKLASDFGMPDVVFIDIEGAECMALEGASNVLQKKPDFFVEVHVAWGLELLGGSIEKMLSFFPVDQFELFVRNDSLSDFQPIQPNDPIFKARFYLLALAR